MKMRRKIKHVLSKLGTKSNNTVPCSQKFQLDSIKGTQKTTSDQQTTSTLSTSNDVLISDIYAQECKVPLKKRKCRQPKLPQDSNSNVKTNSENSIVNDKLVTKPPDSTNESKKHNNSVNSKPAIRIDADSTTGDITPGVKLVKQGKNIDQHLYKLANCNPSYKLSWDNYEVGQYTLKAEKRKLQRQFTCPICDRSFGYKHVLQKHTRIHRGEKPFHCSQCNKGFTQEHHMITHMRIHTGERPYRCSDCPRTFAQVANLRRHLRIHSGERPYACSVCQKTFPSSGHVKKHLRIHTGERPHVCMLCQQAFRLQHHLTDHMKTHRDIGSSCITPSINVINRDNNSKETLAKSNNNATNKSADLSVNVKVKPQVSGNYRPRKCPNTSMLKTTEQNSKANVKSHVDTPVNNCVGGKLDCVIQKLAGKIDKYKSNLNKCDSIIQALKSNQQVEPLDYSMKKVDN